MATRLEEHKSRDSIGRIELFFVATLFLACRGLRRAAVKSCDHENLLNDHHVESASRGKRTGFLHIFPDQSSWPWRFSGHRRGRRTRSYSAARRKPSIRCHSARTTQLQQPARISAPSSRAKSHPLDETRVLYTRAR